MATASDVRKMLPRTSDNPVWLCPPVFGTVQFGHFPTMLTTRRFRIHHLCVVRSCNICAVGNLTVHWHVADCGNVPDCCTCTARRWPWSHPTCWPNNVKLGCRVLRTILDHREYNLLRIDCQQLGISLVMLFGSQLCTSHSIWRSTRVVAGLECRDAIEYAEATSEPRASKVCVRHWIEECKCNSSVR